MRIVLASKSAARAQILRNAGVAVDVRSAGVDEGPLKASALAKGLTSRQIAETLAAGRKLDGIDCRAESVHGQLMQLAIERGECRFGLSARYARANAAHGLKPRVGRRLQPIGVAGPYQRLDAHG